MRRSLALLAWTSTQVLLPGREVRVSLGLPLVLSCWVQPRVKICVFYGSFGHKWSISEENHHRSVAYGKGVHKRGGTVVFTVHVLIVLSQHSHNWNFSCFMIELRWHTLCCFSCSCIKMFTSFTLVFLKHLFFSLCFNFHRFPHRNIWKSPLIPLKTMFLKSASAYWLYFFLPLLFYCLATGLLLLASN